MPTKGKQCLLLLGLIVLLCPPRLASRPFLTVIWESFGKEFLDHQGQPLAQGQPGKNKDGALIQLGYFTASTSENLFAGEWMPLVLETSIGDSEDFTGLGDGVFSFTTYFTDGTEFVPVYDPSRPGNYTTTASQVITTSSPSPGKFLAIRFHDGSWDGMQRYNTISSPTWQWGQLSELSFGSLTIYADFLEPEDAHFEDPANPFKATLPIQDAWDYGNRPVGNNWYWLYWYGHYTPSGSSPWHYHEMLGWVYPHGERPGDIWLYQTFLGWLWTNTGSFPFLWSDADQDWVYIKHFEGACWLYRYKTETWGILPDGGGTL